MSDPFVALKVSATRILTKARMAPYSVMPWASSEVQNFFQTRVLKILKTKDSFETAVAQQCTTPPSAFVLRDPIEKKWWQVEEPPATTEIYKYRVPLSTRHTEHLDAITNHLKQNLQPMTKR